jgi:hypothetical protein
MEAITSGTILIEDGTYLPSSVILPDETQSNGWTAVQSPRSTFEKQVEDAGWTFFFMAGEIKISVFGFDKQKALHTALERLLTNVKSHQCNSMEITQVTDKSFLKLPYVCVSAHMRHLQKGSVFAGAAVQPLG